MLGIVDEATNLQQVARLPNREPASVLKAFREVWVRPYGMPHRITMDQDGAFMGEFWTYVVDQATEADYVPPDAHHRLGKAERCNAVYREILNRVVDGMAIATTDDMEQAIDATTHAINSMPRTRGKGPKKKGGYVIGRLVTFDGRCAWVQLGTQTVKVDRNQLRPAYGFESWAPDAEDIQALKDAEGNLLDDNVQSLEGPPPPDDEPVEPTVVIPPTPSMLALPAPLRPLCHQPRQRRRFISSHHRQDPAGVRGIPRRTRQQGPPIKSGRSPKRDGTTVKYQI